MLDDINYLGMDPYFHSILPIYRLFSPQTRGESPDLTPELSFQDQMPISEMLS